MHYRSFGLIPVDIRIVGLNRSLSFTNQSIEDKVLRPLINSVFFRPRVSLTLIEPKGGVVKSPRSQEVGRVETGLPTNWESFSINRIPQERLEKTYPMGGREIRYRGAARNPERTLRNLWVFLGALRMAQLVGEEFVAPVVVFLRPDVRIEDRVPIRTIVFLSALFHVRKIPAGFFPSWKRWGGFNDRFAVLSSLAARQYFSRIEIFEEFFSSAKPQNSEKLLKQSMKGARVFNVVHSRMLRVRVGGAEEAADRMRYRPSRFGMTALLWLNAFR